MQYISLRSADIQRTTVDSSSNSILNEDCDNGIIELNNALQNTVWTNIDRHTNNSTQAHSAPHTGIAASADTSSAPPDAYDDVKEPVDPEHAHLDTEFSSIEQLLSDAQALRKQSQSGTLTDIARRQQAEQLIRKMMAQYNNDNISDSSDEET